MDINKPDRGVFRGMGQLEGSNIQNRKNFPRIRNAHQHEYTHLHRNDYMTSFQRYFTTNKNTTTTQKVKGNSNQSTLQLGSDPKNYVNSLSRTDYRHFEKVVPPKPIRHKEEWAGLGDELKDNHFVTTTMERFGKLEEPGKHRVTFKNRGADRFNPITGEPRTLAFGFEDF